MDKKIKQIEELQNQLKVTEKDIDSGVKILHFIEGMLLLSGENREQMSFHLSLIGTYIKILKTIKGTKKKAS